MGFRAASSSGGLRGGVHGDKCDAQPLRADSFRWRGAGQVGTLTNGLADEAWLGFIAALTLLLVTTILVVIRQPPWIPPPPDESGGQHGGPEPVERWPAAPGPSYGRHSAGAVPGPVTGRANGQAARPAAAPGAGQRPVPLPVRQPGQSGWPQPAGTGRLAGPGSPAEPDGLAWPEGGTPRVTGGPPWGPAPRPPGALP